MSIKSSVSMSSGESLPKSFDNSPPIPAADFAGRIAPEGGAGIVRGAVGGTSGFGRDGLS